MPTAHRILVVDDEPLIIAGLRRVLGHGSCEVLHAPSGQEALAILAQSETVDLVISDESMPGMGTVPRVS